MTTLTHGSTIDTASSSDWWRGAVIYQVYPRSFQDSDGDGCGDLAGITGRLDHIASLGVDALWICPFYPSPMKDFGYDVSEHCDVDPRFGTLADFDALVARAHQLGLKVLIDLVLSHTSDRHPWFEQSRSGRNHPKADWYVWADGVGEPPRPPNNWISLFGGPAWEWDAGREQYYQHNFLASQPDLNFHQPQVQQAALDIARFWLERGVDGFRLDTANYYFHDIRLRDNPPAQDILGRADGLPEGTPYASQQHVYDKSRPENLAFVERLRALVDAYPGRTLLAEIGDDDALGRMAEYTAGSRRLHMAYSFHLLGPRFGTDLIVDTLRQFERRLDGGWPCWSIGNHDVPRVASRWPLADEGDAAQRLLMAMLLSMRGSACIYQGEELGLPEADIGQEDLQDPFGIAHWPLFKGRDGCRTPMPWSQDGPGAGFTSAARPWLPVPASHVEKAVSVQEAAKDSLLKAYRRFLGWRRRQPALVAGELEICLSGAEVLAWVRRHERQQMLVVLNFTDLPQRVLWQVLGRRALPLSGHGFAATLDDQGLALPPWGAFFGTVAAL